jgi:glycosyltransferase involved in cell wall biosynthesis
VSKSLIKHLQKEFDITVLDFYQEVDSFVGGVKVLGKKHKDDNLALRRFMDVCEGFDAIFFLNDVWNVGMYLRILKEKRNAAMGNFKLPKIVTYTPVDAEAHSPAWYMDFDIVSAPVTYTEFAKRVIYDAHSITGQRMNIIPHGIDTDVFFKSQTDRKKIREHVYQTNAFDDSFVFMNANRNQPRKRIDITVRAFAEFLKNTGAKNAFLHLHCGLIDYGFDIAELVKRFGVDHRVIVSGEKMMQNVSSEHLNLYYNAADVGLNSSLGEGWGLTSCEHAVTGAPQIVPQHSACIELFGGLNLVAQANEEITLMESITVGRIPCYKAMAYQMGVYYNQPELLAEHGDAAMKRFTQEKYNWKNIAAQFSLLFK